jgi:hypothetical protein
MKITRKQSANNLPFDPNTVEVVVREITLGDMQAARRVAGIVTAQDQIDKQELVTAALIARACTFDEKQYVAEDIMNWSASFVGELGNALAQEQMTA